MFTKMFSRTGTTHPSIFLGRVLWADSVSLRMNAIVSRGQFKPIRVGETLAVNYKLRYIDFATNLIFPLLNSPEDRLFFLVICASTLRRISLTLKLIKITLSSA